MGTKSAVDNKTSAADLKDQAGTVAGDLVELGRLARDVLAERADELKQGALNTAGNAREKVDDASEALAERVRDRPLRGLAIAAGVGTLLGILWSRRS
ncbi:MAG: hypothetical protein DHS20C15_26310 [Planctomycetota bacterium]|nr:MAG: hypothetical protein DHS20C15_26310 [Planctomycetota bacterium]